MQLLPTHLKKYVVEQNYEKYTPVDHAVWRFILRQLKSYLMDHAHESYVSGLEKTGIEIERIPKISEINRRLEKFGWRAIPVSGFIPPAAFMELQSLGVLPIASDMRSAEHLTYTPAPDIVHEAAGHAPILIHPEFAEYLRKYAQIAKKAIISREDIELYEAIRVLSDIKENPQSTAGAISKAELQLKKTSQSMSHVSEATQLSRMNWWTAEYGLIGSLQDPKIFGAGLLSSVGEASLCLSDKVKKIPLSIDCIKLSYDITEPQPQLFVARDFKHLSQVIDELAEQMAFRRGGVESLEKIIEAESVNTVQLDSGLQISGVLKSLQLKSDNKEEVSYLSFIGPTQLCYKDKELVGHSKTYHKDGFGSPLGNIKGHSKKLSDWKDADWQKINVVWDGEHLGSPVPLALNFESGVAVEGQLVSRVTADAKNLILKFQNVRVTLAGKILFDPAWGSYDMALGFSIPSVFGGPADREAFGDTSDFVAKRVPAPQYTENQLKQQHLYQKIRETRENRMNSELTISELEELESQALSEFSQDWLIALELFEIAKNLFPQAGLTQRLEERLKTFTQTRTNLKNLIQDGLKLAQEL